MGNVPLALISLSFSIICAWKPLMHWAPPVISPGPNYGTLWCKLFSSPNFSTSCWSVSAGSKWEAPKSGLNCPAGVSSPPGITQKCVTIPKSSASRRTLWKPICSKSPLSSEPCWGCCWSADCVLPCFYPAKNFGRIRRSFQIVPSDVAIGQPPPLSIESFWYSSSWYGSRAPLWHICLWNLWYRGGCI